MKKCKFCSELIQDEAIKCRFCGEWLNKKESLIAETTDVLRNSILNSISFIKEKKAELEIKRYSHLYLPSDENPFVYNNINFLTSKFVVDGKEFLYNDIAFINFIRHIEKVNGIKSVEKIRFILLLTKELSSFTNVPFQHLDLSYRPILAIFRTKESERAEFLKNYLMNFTFENRLSRYMYFLMRDGYFTIAQYEIHNNGDIIKDSKLLKNLLVALNEGLVDYQNIKWRGLNSSTFNPNEMVVYINRRPIAKVFGIDLTEKIILPIDVNQDVFEALLSSLIKNGKII